MILLIEFDFNTRRKLLVFFNKYFLERSDNFLESNEKNIAINFNMNGVMT
jgi:hypothetical protein